MTLLNDGAPFLASQATDLGLSRADLLEALRSGRLRRVFRGVVVDAATTDTRDLRLDALALIIPPDSVVALHTAASIWGVETRPPSQLRELRPTVLARHGGTRPHESRAIVWQTTIPDGDAVEIRGVRVTSPLRTAVDLLRRSWRPHALAAGDAFVRSGVVVLADLQEEVSRWRRLPGLKQAKQLAQWIDPDAETPGESWLRCRVLDAGLPRPVLNLEVSLRDGRVRRLDAAWPEQLVAAEYDGRASHTGAPDRAYDTARREDLAEELYWQIQVARYEQIFGTETTFEARLGELLGRPVAPRTW